MFGKKLICPECGSQNVRAMKYEVGQYECLKEGCGFVGKEEEFKKK